MLRFLVATVFSLSIVCLATTTSRPKLAQVLTNAAQVLHVRILASKVKQFVHDGKLRTCGISYRAEIIDVVRGTDNNKEVAFTSPASLAAGDEYIVMILRHRIDELPEGAKWLEQPDYLNADSYKKCISKLPSKQVGKLYKFYETFLDQSGAVQWLLLDYRSPIPPDDIRIVKVHCESDQAMGCESISEPALINWASLKKYIQNVQ